MLFMLLLVVFGFTTSNTAVSGILLSFSVPGILLAILAGAYVDRRDKKFFLVWTNVLRGLLLASLAFFTKNLIGLYLLVFVISIITQFFIPAETPMIPLLVDKKALFAANALFGIAFYGSILIAYALSGPFLIFFGPQEGLLILAFFFLVASFFASLIKRPKPQAQRRFFASIKRQNVVTDIKDAVSLIVKVKNLYHSFLLLILYQTLIFVIAVIGPGYARQILNIPIAQFPLLFVTPAALGMTVGAFIIIRYFHNSPKKHVATIGIFISAISLFLLPYGSKVALKSFVMTLNVLLPHFLQITVLHIMVILAFILGIANALIFVPSNTIIQEETSDEVRGKIYGVLNTLISIISFIPILVVGSFADIFGVAHVLTAIAIFLAAIGIFRSLVN